MPKTYTVDPEGTDAAPRIEDTPVAAALRGPTIVLPEDSVSNGKAFATPGALEVSFAASDSVGTTGLGHCLGLCVVWGRSGPAFANGYCAHLSSVQGSRYTGCLSTIESKMAPHNPWVAISIGSSGTWIQTLLGDLLALNIADNHIWVYNRADKSNTFGVDKLGRFGLLSPPG
jgi:hypothetical protein